jgi:hypothetical protein
MTARAPTTKVSRETRGINFQRVIGSPQDIETLYELLRMRENGISHVSMPTRASHRKFVLSHPYRFWYIVEETGVALGSLYFHFDNSIGISMPGQSSAMTRATLSQALALHKPLKGVKSVRSSHFFVNVRPGDHVLRRALMDLGWGTLQVTYAAINKPSLGAKCV